LRQLGQASIDRIVDCSVAALEGIGQRDLGFQRIDAARGFVKTQKTLELLGLIASSARSFSRKA